MEGKPMQLPLKELFWGRQGTHPLRPSEPCYSTLRCAADVQPDPTSRFPPETTRAHPSASLHTGTPDNTVRQLNLLPLV